MELTLRCEAEGNRQHDAAPGEDTDIVLTVDGGWAGGVERVRVRGAIGRDVLRERTAGQRDAGGGRGVEDVVEAQAELGLVKAAAGSESVVDEGVRHVEAWDGELIVVSAVVDVFPA